MFVVQASGTGNFVGFLVRSLEPWGLNELEKGFVNPKDLDYTPGGSYINRVYDQDV